jgi:hypothetical protein
MAALAHTTASTATLPARVDASTCSNATARSGIDSTAAKSSAQRCAGCSNRIAVAHARPARCAAHIEAPARVASSSAAASARAATSTNVTVLRNALSRNSVRIIAHCRRDDTRSADANDRLRLLLD